MKAKKRRERKRKEGGRMRSYWERRPLIPLKEKLFLGLMVLVSIMVLLSSNYVYEGGLGDDSSGSTPSQGLFSSFGEWLAEMGDLITGAGVVGGELGIQATYCGGEYTGGNWVVNSSVSCSDEAIPVDGTLTVRNDNETSVSGFSLAHNSVYDLSSNATMISAAVPDLDKSGPSQYTKDWDSNANREFYIVMNESEHMIQIWANATPGSGDWFYYVDIDGNDSSGEPDGWVGGDLRFGYNSEGGTFGLACYNSTEGDMTGIASSGQGQETCDTGWDGRLLRNFTVYYNISGNTTEIAVNVTGSWIDKQVIATNDADEYYFTIFKNTTADEGGVGNLTLKNVTLNLENSLEIESDAYFTANYSNITFNLNSNNSANLTVKRGITEIVINNTDIQANDTSLRFHFKISDGGFTLENGKVDNLWAQVGSCGGICLNMVEGGTIDNITFGSNLGGLSTQCIYLTGCNVRILNSNCTSITPTIAIHNSNSGNNTITENHISMFEIDEGYNTTVSENVIYSQLILEAEDASPANNTLLNNNLSDAIINDKHTTFPNYFVYNNSYGEIRWELSNASINTAANLSLGDKINVEDNNLGLEMNENLANFNGSANLTFYGLSWGANTQLCENVSGSLANCYDCNSTNNCSYSAGTMVAKVGHFSNYSSNGTTNNAPSVTTPTITPSTAYTNDTLETNTTYTDADNNTGTVYFLWYNDGVNIHNQTNSSVANGTVVVADLASGNFSAFEEINVSIYANDGLANSSTVWSSNTIEIQNTAPEAQAVNVSSSDSLNRTNGTLTGVYTFYDLDGDTETGNETQWYNGSELVSELDNFTSIDSGNTTKGESWVFSVRVNDSEDSWSSWVNSTAMVIENTAPEAQSVNVSSADSLNRTNGTLSGVWSFYDLDGDVETGNETQWYNGSVLVSDLENLSSVASGNTTKGESWVFSVRVNDTNNSWSEWVNATAMVIENTAPEAQSVNVSSSDSGNRTNGTLTGVYTFYDLDGDLQTGNETQWYNNSEQVTDLDNLTEVNSANTTKGQSWIFSVRVNDTNNSWAEWVNATAMVIENTAPNQTSNISDVSISVGASTTVNLSAYFNDLDGDELNYTAENVSVATIAVNNSDKVMTITGVSAGSNTSWINAGDGTDTTISNNFTIAVSAAEAPSPEGGGGVVRRGVEAAEEEAEEAEEEEIKEELVKEEEEEEEEAPAEEVREEKIGEEEAPRVEEVEVEEEKPGLAGKAWAGFKGVLVDLSWLWICLVVLLSCIGGGIYIYKKRARKEEIKKKALELGRFILECLESGISKEEVKGRLVSRGWPERIAEEYVEKYVEKYVEEYGRRLVEKEAEDKKRREEESKKRKEIEEKEVKRKEEEVKRKRSWEGRLEYIEGELGKLEREGVKIGGRLVRRVLPLGKIKEAVSGKIRGMKKVKVRKESREEKKWKRELGERKEEVERELELMERNGGYLARKIQGVSDKVGSRKGKRLPEPKKPSEEGEKKAKVKKKPIRESFLDKNLKRNLDYVEEELRKLG